MSKREEGKRERHRGEHALQQWLRTAHAALEVWEEEELRWFMKSAELRVEDRRSAYLNDDGEDAVHGHQIADVCAQAYVSQSLLTKYQLHSPLLLKPMPPSATVA